jgi:drug/metabolite transporter (DMT)-like permease
MWIAASIFACFTSATLVLLLKVVGLKLGGSLSLQQGAGVAGCVLVGAGALGLAVLACLPREITVPLRPHASWLAGAAVALVLSQIAVVAAINGAPNPGFAHLVVNFNMLLVTVAAVFLFGSRLGWQSAVGMAVAAAGLALVLCSK